MGIDAEYYFKPGREIPPDELEELSKEWKRLSENRYSRIHQYAPGIYQADTLDRLFEEGYPRGHWTTMRNKINWIRETFPGCKFYYLSDAIDYEYLNDMMTGDGITEDELKALDKLWEELNEKK